MKNYTDCTVNLVLSQQEQITPKQFSCNLTAFNTAAIQSISQKDE
jgi:hypothetical protein